MEIKIETEIPEIVGNASTTAASITAEKYGFTKVAAARYSWSDYNGSGREYYGPADIVADIRQRLEIGVYYENELPDGTTLPRNLHYWPETEMLVYSVVEDYGCGQSSTIYFSK